MGKKKQEQKTAEGLSWGWKTAIAIGVVVGLVQGIVWIGKYIDSRIRAQVLSPEFLEEIASRVRPPVVIFDANESILQDLGGMRYIDRIRVDIGQRPHTSEVGIRKIIVSPKVCLERAPILTSADNIFTHDIRRPQRGEGLDWEYEIKLTARTMTSLRSGEQAVPQFRLEVIPN